MSATDTPEPDGPASTALRDRFRGAVVGTAVGDALGAPFEGHPHPDPAAVRSWAEAGDLLRWTDDTAMTLGVARSLAAVGGFDGPDLARRFTAAYEAEPWRGYGAGPPQIFAQLRQGAEWDEPAKAMFGGSGSYGNGAAMRVAPVGLWCHDDQEEVGRLARDTARITHAHARGLQGAALQAGAVARLVADGPPDDAVGFVDGLLPLAPDAQYRERLGAIARLGVDAGGADVEQVRAALGTGIAAAESVPAALYAALRHRTSFAETVRYAVGLGGDADTIAAMAGALAGAALGMDAVPSRWRARLESHADLVQAADDLYDAWRDRT